MSRHGRRGAGMFLVELMAYLAIFTLIAGMATVLSVRAYRFVTLGLEAAEQRYRLDRALR